MFESWVARAVLYVAVMVAVYLDYHVPALAPLLQTVKWTCLPVLAVAVVIATRFWGRRFEVTPLDLLLIFAAVVLPNLPGLARTPHNLGLSVVKLVVLCYAVELISTLDLRLRTSLFGVSALFFVVIALRAFT